MAKVTTKAGVCGFDATIEATVVAETDEGITVGFSVKSSCPHITKAAAEMEDINAYEEIFKKPADTSIYKTLAKHLPHTACPIYSSFFKAAEVAAGLALPTDVTIKIEK